MKKLFLTIILLISPTLAVADSTTVITNVVNSVSTGGQSESGSSQSEVRVYTEINGEVVEDFNKVSDEPTQYHNEVERSNSSTETSVEINMNSSMDAPVSRGTLDTSDTLDRVEGEEHERAEGSEEQVTVEPTRLPERIRNWFAYVFKLFRF